MSAWHLPEAIAVADLNHDGHNDIVALHSGWLALTLYLGRADGSIAIEMADPGIAVEALVVHGLGSDVSGVGHIPNN